MPLLFFRTLLYATLQHNPTGLSPGVQALVRAGFIGTGHAAGLLDVLPLGRLAIQRIADVVRAAMHEIGAAQVQLPLLCTDKMWQSCGRMLPEEGLVTRDRKGRTYLLSPTHEELATELARRYVEDGAGLPLRLFQIGTKFRDELRPRGGLLRAREFLMKDMYTYDVDETAALATYDVVVAAYEQMFRALGLPVVKASADGGMMGAGKRCDEFHLLSDIGDDRVMICDACGFTANSEVHAASACPRCSGALRAAHGIEVAHTFHLADKYTRPLGVLSPTLPGEPAQMCCFGVGVSRLLGAAAEVCHDDDGLRLPLRMCPVDVACVGDAAVEAAHEIHARLSVALTRNDVQVLVDDRPAKRRTVGGRIRDVRRTGAPFTVVANGTPGAPGAELVELHRRSDPYGTYEVVSMSSAVEHIARALQW